MIFARLAASAATLSLLAVPALAGGFAEPVAAPVVAPPPPVTVAAAPAPSGDWTGGFAGIHLGFGTLGSDDLFGDEDFDGTLLGLHTGYDRDFGRFVLGGEIQYDRADLSFDAAAEDDSDVDSVFRAGLRAGYDAGRLLPYVTGGYARAELSGAVEETIDGGYLGIGAEFAVTERISVGAEYLHHNFNDVVADDLEAQVDVLSLRTTWRF